MKKILLVVLWFSFATPSISMGHNSNEYEVVLASSKKSYYKCTYGLGHKGRHLPNFTVKNRSKFVADREAEVLCEDYLEANPKKAWLGCDLKKCSKRSKAGKSKKKKTKKKKNKNS